MLNLYGFRAIERAPPKSHLRRLPWRYEFCKHKLEPLSPYRFKTPCKVHKIENIDFLSLKPSRIISTGLKTGTACRAVQYSINSSKFQGGRAFGQKRPVDVKITAYTVRNRSNTFITLNFPPGKISKRTQNNCESCRQTISSYCKVLFSFTII